MLRTSIGYRYPTLSVKKVHLSTAEACDKTFIQLRHSTMEKQKNPYVLRVQITHSFVHSCSSYTPETSQHAATPQLKAGTSTELSQTKP